MKRFLTGTALSFLSVLTALAGPVTIPSYNITDALTSGSGGWAHTYSGTITPGASFFNGGAPVTAAVYTGGSGTLNDGVIGTTEGDTQLFIQGSASDGTPVNPVITLFLPGSFTINSISLFGGPVENAIPGCFTGLTVGIGGSSAAIPTTDFGPSGGCSVVNDLATITATSLEGRATNTIVLSNFTGPLFANWFSITEIEIDGQLTDGVAAPEPATFGLIGAGLLLIGIRETRRRWRG